MVAIAAAATVIDALTSAASSALTPTPASTQAQQASWDQALASAQLGVPDATTGTASQATSDDAKHLVLFSMLQTSVMHAMDTVERGRQEALQDD